MGSVVKALMPGRAGVERTRVYHATLMPCFDKKLEASREDFTDSETGDKEVDCVITTLEIEELLEQKQIRLSQCEPSKLDTLSPGEDGLVRANTGSGSGGYSDHLFRYLARHEFNQELETLSYKVMKNTDFREVTLERDGKAVLKFAIANGFRNIQNLVQKLKRKRCDYDFVEILACPSGCLNGGAQLRPQLEMSAKVVSLTSKTRRHC